QHPELDPIRDLQAGGLARVLDDPDELARDALAPEVVVELELERDGHAAVARDAPALERLLGEVHVAGDELHAAAGGLDDDGLLASERGGERPVVRLERGGD